MFLPNNVSNKFYLKNLLNLLEKLSFYFEKKNNYITHLVSNKLDIPHKISPLVNVKILKKYEF